MYDSDTKRQAVTTGSYFLLVASDLLIDWVDNDSRKSLSMCTAHYAKA